VLLLLLLLLLLTTLDSVLIKKYFHTRKNLIFSMTTMVRSQLAYPKNAPFPICI
jgi:rRNA pseudouridine-1189 N-methylase Emg1 (Nep1/Mra1 family)